MGKGMALASQVVLLSNCVGEYMRWQRIPPVSLAPAPASILTASP